MSLEDALLLAACAVLFVVLGCIAPRALLRPPRPEVELAEAVWECDGPVIDAEAA